MKKVFLSGLLTLVTLVTFSQIAYYDAVELSKYIDYESEPLVFKNDNASLNSVSEILLKYCQDLPATTDFHNVISAITTDHPDNKNYNPILAPFLDIIVPQGTADVSVKSLISSAGNLNVTGFVDGLAKFLVERSKEELNVAFFKKFQDFFKEHPEVQVIFPTTFGFLNSIYSYQYAAMLPALKAAFQKDLNAFSSNLLNLGDVLKYDEYLTNEEVRKKADEIISLMKTPGGRSVLAAVYVSDGIVKGQNIADIISNLAGDDMCKLFPDDNLSNVIQFIDLISNSLRSIDENRVWITRKQVSALVNNDVALRLYLGLIYSTDQKNNHDIHFGLDGKNISFRDVLADLNASWTSVESIAFKESFAAMAVSMSEVADNAKNVMDAAQQGNQSSILVYADYASSISGYLKQSANFLSGNSGLNPSLAVLAADMQKFAGIIDEATNICYDLKSQNYGALVLHSSSLVSELLGPGFTYKDDYIRYGIFMANVVEANNSDEVNAAIEAAVLPVGSSSIKRETDLNISLNAFIGPFGGAEYLPALKQDQWAFTTGLTAPVGIAVSWGNLGKGRIRVNGKEPGGKSISLFLPVIDIGAMASFRMGNDSSEVASEVKLANIISPGLFVYYGFGKCPVSIGLGGQLGPQLREVTASDINTDENYYFRFGFNIVVDIPFFNLYTKN